MNNVGRGLFAGNFPSESALSLGNVWIYNESVPIFTYFSYVVCTTDMTQPLDADIFTAHKALIAWQVGQS